MNEINYAKYIDLIKAGKTDEALNYKNSFIPDVVYKYYCLDEREELNEIKLECLKSAKIYLSNVEDFNDPFEGKFLCFDDKKLSSNGWSRDIIDKYYHYITHMFKIGCVSGVGEHNMPMWAYYANNHAGFCVEYHLSEEQKKYIFPIAYESTRPQGNALITNVIYGIQKMVSDGIPMEEWSSELKEAQQMVMISLVTKHKSWKHEDEYRILNPFDNYFPAIPKKIYIGINCKDQYKQKLLEIGEEFGTYCKVFELQNVGDSETFELEKKI